MAYTFYASAFCHSTRVLDYKFNSIFCQTYHHWKQILIIRPALSNLLLKFAVKDIERLCIIVIVQYLL